MNGFQWKISTVLLRLTVYFLLGSLCGTFMGVVSGGAHASFTPLSRDVSSFEGFFADLLLVSILPIAVWIFSTSTIGHKVIPFFLFIRGWLLSCSLSVLALNSDFGAVPALAVVGLPALFTVPALFLICEDAVVSSRLICLCNDTSMKRSCSSLCAGRFFLALLLLLTGTAVQRFIIPLLF